MHIPILILLAKTVVTIVALSELPNSVKQNIVGFYNVYAEGEFYEGIVQDQIHKMEITGLMDKLDAVYYATVGNSGENYTITNPKFIHKVHHNDGFESDTLQIMYEFCLEHKNSKVLYFHNKGSFHNSPINAKFRRVLDCFNLNPYCIDALDTFDTCGWRISPHPMPHYSGNFWWATCKHVGGLVEPDLLKHNSTFISLTRSISDCVASDGRYFPEAWVASAPHFKPADCMSTDVDTSYIWGYDFSDSFEANFCPHPDNRTFGLQCGNASTFVSLPLFRDLINHQQGWMGQLRKRCKADFYPEIIRRTWYWYGQPAYTYMAWMRTIRAPPTLKDGLAIRPRNSRQVYYVNNNTLHAIPSGQIFASLGLNFDDVVVVEDFMMDELFIGDDATAPREKAPALKDGDAIRYSSGKQVYLFRNGELHKFPNLDVFVRHGLDFADVKIINDVWSSTYKLGTDLQ